MKWIVLSLALLAPHVEATMIQYQMNGSMQRFDPANSLEPFKLSFLLDSESGEITDASAAFLGREWLIGASKNYFVGYFLGLDFTIPVYWTTWSLQLFNNDQKMRFSGSPEWKIYYQGEGYNPLENLDKSVGPVGAMYAGGETYGMNVNITKVPEPATLSLLALGLGLAAMGIRRRLR